MYSFDVYDTLIMRKTHEPSGIFSLMECIILSNMEEWGVPYEFASEFSTIRIDSEIKARLKCRHETTLNKIYEIIESDCDLPAGVCEKLKKLEIKCEIENSVAVEENTKRIESLLKTGERVVLISDMYMPESFFQTLFNAVCPMLNNLKLYLSSEIGFTKSSGLLYKYVSQQEHIAFGKWFHVGDNIVSDVNVPQLLGIHSEMFILPVDEDVLRRNTYICKGESLYVSQYMTGLARTGKKEKSNAYNIGFSIAGIPLYAYVRWVIGKALSRKKKKLLFVARDGYILQKIADLLIDKAKLDISTDYLYGSREAWRVDNARDISLVKQYLLQKTDGDFEHIALVDTQGTGKSIDYLSNICGYRFCVFYYVLIENSMDKNIEAYSYSVHEGGSMIEAFCRAPHGPTTGYKDVNGIIEPELSEFDEATFHKAKLIDYFQGILDLTEYLAGIEKPLPFQLPLLSLSQKIIRFCNKEADKKLADFIGEIPHGSNNKNENAVFAPFLTRREIKIIEYDRTVQDIEEVYPGEFLALSYRRLNQDDFAYVDECRNAYFERKFDKDNDCIDVIIYGYGLYGKELYHRLYGSPKVNVVGIVDMNAVRYVNNPVKISSPYLLHNAEFDYVVISLLNLRICEDIKELLIMAGIEKDKIVNREDFLKRFTIEI